MTSLVDVSDPCRPIMGFNSRTPQEVFDIMCDRIRSRLTAEQANAAEIAELTALLREASAYVRRNPPREAGFRFAEDWRDAVETHLVLTDRIDTILNRENPHRD